MPFKKVLKDSSKEKPGNKSVNNLYFRAFIF